MFMPRDRTAFNGVQTSISGKTGTGQQHRRQQSRNGSTGSTASNQFRKKKSALMGGAAEAQRESTASALHYDDWKTNYLCSTYQATFAALRDARPPLGPALTSNDNHNTHGVYAGEDRAAVVATRKPGLTRREQLLKQRQQQQQQQQQMQNKPFKMKKFSKVQSRVFLPTKQQQEQLRQEQIDLDNKEREEKLKERMRPKSSGPVGPLRRPQTPLSSARSSHNNDPLASARPQSTGRPMSSRSVSTPARLPPAPPTPLQFGPPRTPSIHNGVLSNRDDAEQDVAFFNIVDPDQVSNSEPISIERLEPLEGGRGWMTVKEGSEVFEC